MFSFSGGKSGHHTCSQPAPVYVRQRDCGLWNAKSQGESLNTAVGAVLIGSPHSHYPAFIHVVFHAY